MVELLFFLSIFKDLIAFMFNKDLSVNASFAGQDCLTYFMTNKSNTNNIVRDEQVNMRNYKNVWISSQLAAF